MTVVDDEAEIRRLRRRDFDAGFRRGRKAAVAFLFSMTPSERPRETGQRLADLIAEIDNSFLPTGRGQRLGFASTLAAALRQARCDAAAARGMRQAETRRERRQAEKAP